MAHLYINARDKCQRLAEENPGTQFYVVASSKTRRYFEVITFDEYQELPWSDRHTWKKPKFAWVVNPAQEDA